MAKTTTLKEEREALNTEAYQLYLEFWLEQEIAQFEIEIAILEKKIAEEEKLKKEKRLSALLEKAMTFFDSSTDSLNITNFSFLLKESFPEVYTQHFILTPVGGVISTLSTLTSIFNLIITKDHRPIVIFQTVASVLAEILSKTNLIADYTTHFCFAGGPYLFAAAAVIIFTQIITKLICDINAFIKAETLDEKKSHAQSIFRDITKLATFVVATMALMGTFFSPLGPEIIALAIIAFTLQLLWNNAPKKVKQNIKSHFSFFKKNTYATKKEKKVEEKSEGNTIGLSPAF